MKNINRNWLSAELTKWINDRLNDVQPHDFPPFSDTADWSLGDIVWPRICNSLIVTVYQPGHYKVPSEYKPQSQPLQITGRSDPIIRTDPPALNSTKKLTLPVAIDEKTNSTVNPKGWRKAVATTYNASKLWLNQQENKGLKFLVLILSGCIVMMCLFYKAKDKEIQQLSRVITSTDYSCCSLFFCFVPPTVSVSKCCTYV